jgi:hypothetical protein
VILHRVFPWDGAAGHRDPGGALWFPRGLQGDGRHDAPDRYGCLYVSEEPVSALVEELARFAGAGVAAADLLRGGLPLALAELELAGNARLVDLDSADVLASEGLRPSAVASRERRRTQADALALFRRHRRAAGLRWWSTFDPSWANVTLFDRARQALAVVGVRRLELRDEVVAAAALQLGLRAVG